MPIPIASAADTFSPGTRWFEGRDEDDGNYRPSDCTGYSSRCSAVAGLACACRLCSKDPNLSDPSLIWLYPYLNAQQRSTAHDSGKVGGEPIKTHRHALDMSRSRDKKRLVANDLHQMHGFNLKTTITTAAAIIKSRVYNRQIQNDKINTLTHAAVEVIVGHISAL